MKRMFSGYSHVSLMARKRCGDDISGVAQDCIKPLPENRRSREAGNAIIIIAIRQL